VNDLAVLIAGVCVWDTAVLKVIDEVDKTGVMLMRLTASQLVPLPPLLLNDIDVVL